MIRCFPRFKAVCVCSVHGVNVKSLSVKELKFSCVCVSVFVYGQSL